MRSLRALLSNLVIATLFAAAAAQAADVKAGLGHYTTHLRAGGEREPPPPMPRAQGVRGPVPTNQWYSSLLFSPWPQPLYAQPGSYRPTADGFEIDAPRKEAMHNGARDEHDIVAMHRRTLVVVPDFALTHARAGRASDWAVDVVTGDDTDAMTVTLAHGSPYSFHRLTRGDVRMRAETLEVFHRSADGRGVGLVAGGKPFAVFAPTGSRWDTLPDGLRLRLPDGKRFFSVAALPSRDATALAALHRHAYAFITDTRTEWTFDEQRSELTTHFSVKTEVLEGGDPATVFGLYPHQWHANPLLPPLLPHSFDTIRGPLKLAAGMRFSTRYRYRGLLPFWPALTGAPAARLAEFIAADTQFGADSLLGNRGTYWEGKGLNRAAQVLAIAEQQGDLARRDAILAAMKKRLELWFKPEPDAERYFHYNAALGTLIGYPDEYGSAEQLNDHHFHYGYWIHAAAQIALRDPAWASRERWGAMVELLIADIANANRGERRFPWLRHFDAYEGHSWASGTAPFFDGNNQESSSEAIYAWAAVILWAEATGNKALRDAGIYLYTTEIEATNHYWFDLHGLVFPKDYDNSVAGIVWGNKFVHTTWWTEDPREIHGINFLPITPASLYLAHDPAYLKRNLDAMDTEFTRFIARGGKAPRDIWQDVILSVHALREPKQAIERWNANGAVEDGDSRTRTWHWLQSLLRFGRPALDITANTPLFAVFARDDGTRTYLAYNASSAAKRVRFSDGTELDVAARSLASRDTARR